MRNFRAILKIHPCESYILLKESAFVSHGSTKRPWELSRNETGRLMVSRPYWSGPFYRGLRGLSDYADGTFGFPGW